MPDLWKGGHDAFEALAGHCGTLLGGGLASDLEQDSTPPGWMASAALSGQ